MFSNSKTNWKYLLSVIIIVFIVSSGIYYQYWQFTRKEAKELPIIPTRRNTSAIQEGPEINLVGSVKLSARAGEIYVSGSTGGAIYLSGNYAYIGEDQGIIDIIDISNASNPVIISDIGGKSTPRYEHSPLYTYDFYIVENYLYMLEEDISHDTVLDIWDISNVTEPKFINLYHAANKFYSQEIDGFGNYLFLGINKGISILDISNPEKPALVGKYEDDIGRIEHLYVSDDYLYVPGFILDISNKTQSKLAGRYNNLLGGSVRDFFVAGETAYITISSVEQGDSLMVFDVSNPSNITLIQSYTKEGKEMGNIYVSGQYAYVNYENGLLIFDVSKPDNLNLIKEIPRRHLGIFTIKDNYIYSITNLTESGLLQIFEIKYK